jgi:dihydroflavonol-4-reductase
VALAAAHAVDRGGPRVHLVNLDETRLARHPLWFSSAKAQRELGYTWRPAEQAIAEAVSRFQGVT